MSYVTMLLVENDPVLGWSMIRALERHRFPRPQFVQNGRDAIEWVSRNSFGLCFIDYDLPDMSGVELTILLRQRRPDLPIFMLSGAKSESVAVAAFRAGVTDYLPKDKQLGDAVVRVAERFSEADGKLAAIPRSHEIPDDMPPELLTLTYQNRLRVIGRQIDLNRYHLPSIFEVDGGFLVRALPDHGRKAEAIEFPDRDFLHWITDAYRNRGHGERGSSTSSLLPSGFEDFLRAIGAALDRHEAEAVTISVYSSIVVIAGNTKAGTPAQSSLGDLQWVLRQDDVRQVLDEGYRRRKQSRSQKTGSVVERIFGRQDQIQAAPA